MSIKQNNKELPILLKSGSTDLRRQEKSLTELIEKNYKGGMQLGRTYGFSNRKNTAIKFLVVNQDASVGLVKLKRTKPYPWPKYQEKGNEGYVVALEGKKKRAFLKKVGYTNKP